MSHRGSDPVFGLPKTGSDPLTGAMAKARAKHCPECGKKFRFTAVKDSPGFPFCSERCKTIDLARWLKHEYAVVEDLKEGLDLKANVDLDQIDAPDALEDLEREA